MTQRTQLEIEHRARAIFIANTRHFIKRVLIYTPSLCLFAFAVHVHVHKDSRHWRLSKEEASVTTQPVMRTAPETPAFVTKNVTTPVADNLYEDVRHLPAEINSITVRSYCSCRTCCKTADNTTATNKVVAWGDRYLAVSRDLEGKVWPFKRVLKMGDVIRLKGLSTHKKIWHDGRWLLQDEWIVSDRTHEDKRNQIEAR